MGTGNRRRWISRWVEAVRSRLKRTATTTLAAPIALVALGAVLGLSACGFRLMSSDPLPGILARPYLALKDPYTDFSREFEHQLKSSGATLQAVSANATVTIDVTKDQVERRTLAVTARNIPTEYELTYTVTFSVQGADQELLAPHASSRTGARPPRSTA